MDNNPQPRLSIAIGADHAGYPYKQALLQHLAARHEMVDFGTHGPASVDYPDFAHPVAQAVASGQCAFGILVCGSGNGVAITANKHPQVRAALCWNEEIAQLARQHNNANIICLPARFVSPTEAVQMAQAFLQTDFEGGRHQQRVQKIAC